jgi:hypothetical protein
MRALIHPLQTGSDALQGTEDFRVDVLGEYIPLSQSITHVLQERSWAAQIEVAIPRNPDSLQQSCVDVP